MPPRAVMEAFEIVTQDVTIVDLGTVFTVTVDGPAHESRVAVEEGEVLVRHALGETYVRAPSTWSSKSGTANAPLARAATEVAPALPSVEAPPRPPAVRQPSKHARDLPRRAATLEQEAQLLRQGLAAERSGNATDAIAAFRQLLGQYPHSPLAPDARAALSRVEAKAATHR